MRIGDGYDVDGIQPRGRSDEDDDRRDAAAKSAASSRPAGSATAAAAYDEWSANAPWPMASPPTPAPVRTGKGGGPPATTEPARDRYQEVTFRCDAGINRHDYDRCGSDPNPGPARSATLRSSAFIRQASDVDAVSPADVAQDRVGDCYLHATLAGMAATKEGRAAIRDAIHENKDAQGNVASYSVKLFDTTQQKWRTFVVSANDPYVAGHAIARTGTVSPGQGQTPETRYEVWPLLIEKGYAMLRGNYNAMGKGGRPCVAMEALTGKPASHVKLADAPYGASRIGGDLAAGKVVVMSSLGVLPPPVLYDAEGHKHPNPFNPYGMVAGHAYTVMGVAHGAGPDGQPQTMIRLHNPWNTPDDEPPPVPEYELLRFFSAVDVGEVR